MPRASIVREVEVKRTPRVMQVEGIFDIPVVSKSSLKWDVDLQLPDEWNVGVIVGPSGSGKTTIATELFGETTEWEWPDDSSIIDGFPRELTTRDITDLLSSVGLSSPPVWLRPYRVLSNGERFRVSVARTLAESPALALIDEYSSVVDRTVAQIGSAAIAKTTRRRGQRLIAVTCHYDVIEWLQPEWVYDVSTGELARGHLQRPKIDIEVRRVHHSAWGIFRGHHYLTANLNKAAACYVGFYKSEPIAFTSYLPFVGRGPRATREHRTVTLPDYQGVGIGNALADYIAAAYKARGMPIIATASHPAIIHGRNRSPNWAMTRKPSLAPKDANSGSSIRHSTDRLTASFRYVGPALTKDEAKFLDWE